MQYKRNARDYQTKNTIGDAVHRVAADALGSHCSMDSAVSWLGDMCG